MKKFWNEARLSDKILGGLLALVIIGWSATTIHANITSGNTIIEPEASQIEEVEVPMSNTITAVEAREIAVSLVGGGTVRELNLDVDGEDSIFDIIVNYDGDEHQVTLDALNGALIQLDILQFAENDSSSDLSAEEAIDLAKQYLDSIDITTATFVYSYSDREDGVAVWSIEFKYNGRDLEFYVEKATGDFLKYPMASSDNNDRDSVDSNPTSAPTSSPAPKSSSTPAPPPTPAPTLASTPPPVSNETISRERAGEIALSVSGGRLVEVSRSSHHGRSAWWAETRANGMVHEFYIDTETGAVLQHEVERDD